MATYTIDIAVNIILRVDDIEAASYDEAVEKAREKATDEIENNRQQLEWIDCEYSETDCYDENQGVYNPDTDRNNLIEYLKENIELEEWEIEQAKESLSNEGDLPVGIEEDIEDSVESWCEDVMNMELSDVWEHEDCKTLFQDVYCIN